MIGQTRCGALRRWTHFHSVLWCGGLVLSGLAGASIPPAPTELTATPNGHTEVDVEFRSDASLTRNLVFDPEMTTNGAAGASFRKRNPFGRVGDGPYFQGTYQGLFPNVNYCIRYRARDAASGEVSAPSDWACAHTFADPPPAPSVSATVTVAGAVKPRPQINWSMNSDAYAHGAAPPSAVHYTVERQGPVGPQWPWLLQADFWAGPDPGMAVLSTTPFAFTQTVAPIDPKIHYVYRVCVENDGGKTCTQADLVIQGLEARGTASISAPGALGGPRVVTSPGPDLQGGAMSRPSTQTDRPLNWGAGSAGPSKFPPSSIGLTASPPPALGLAAAPARAPDRNAPHVVNPEPPSPDSRALGAAARRSVQSVAPAAPGHAASPKPVVEESLPIR